MNRILASRETKIVVFLLCLVPLLMLGWWAYRGELTANPIEFITHDTGDWTLRFLLIALTVTPLRKLAGLPNLIKLRRMFGLYAFFYGFLHFGITYLWLDKFFDVHEIWKDIAKRPYITVGFTGYMLMVPLAVTSTWGWVRRLGGKRWQRLHRLVYFCALAGVIHYYWLVKSDVRLPLMYGGILTVLMLYRVRLWTRKGTIQKPKPQPAAAVRA
jgi:methionine sulfoxide reductase heme-binding subunit